MASGLFSSRIAETFLLRIFTALFLAGDQLAELCVEFRFILKSAARLLAVDVLTD